MSEKITEEWDFQKDGMPFDELPNVVKRNPRFLYEYVRTGELPDIDLIEDFVKYDIKAAKKVIEFGKRNGCSKRLSELSKTERFLKEYSDEYFIESGYYKTLFTFEEIYNDISYFEYNIGPIGIKKITYQLNRLPKVRGIFVPDYKLQYVAQCLWARIIILIAEDKLKELEKYELNK